MRRIGSKWGSIGLMMVVCLISFDTGSGIVAAAIRELPKEPLLRVETGMHISSISSVAVDDENRFLVTASSDKTVRLWSLSTGRLVRTLRPPIGKGLEGRMNSVTISPDGRLVSCGGYTKSGEDTVSVYIFDRATGALQKRIAGFPGEITRVAFSPDGRFLAVAGGGGGKWGIRIYRKEGWTLAGEDWNYNGRIGGLDVDRSGRLVSSSEDGYVRLYDKGFQLEKKEKASGGSQPYGVRFSPDGSRVAVGFRDHRRNRAVVDILSGSTLGHLFSNDIAKSGWSLSAREVAWSRDGRFLFAVSMAGKGIDKPVTSVRRWEDGGRGSHRDFEISSEVARIVPLRDGGIVFATDDPAWGVIKASGQQGNSMESPSTDFRGGWERFLASPDGTTVQFVSAFRGGTPTRFSIRNRSLEVNPQSPANLYPPLTTAKGLEIKAWKNEKYPNPIVNGASLNLPKGDASRAIAISPDAEYFLVATDQGIVSYDRGRNKKWGVAPSTTTWLINVAGNGQVAIAAHDDGTISWLRTKDGKLMLSLFPHSDGKRWVLWTPSGHYDASPGGEELIGWHVNNGSDKAADFFAVSRFRSKYYRPDIIARVLDDLDVNTAIRLADEESGRGRSAAKTEGSDGRKTAEEEATNLKLPPVVTILSPQDGAVVTNAGLALRVSIRSPSGIPVTRVRALVDGRPAADERGVQVVERREPSSPGEELREVRVTMPEKDTEIAILAETREGISEPAILRLHWGGASKKDEFTAKPKLYVLSIGVGVYQDKNLSLGFAAKDARDFAEALHRQAGGLYREVSARVLVDEKATKEEILDGLDWIRQATTSRDVAMIFLAGHGVNDQAGIYYFLPSNADIGRLMRTGVAFSDIRNSVASLAGKTVLFVDTCHSGNVMGGRRAIVDISGVVNELSSAENGAVVFASATGRQYSLEDKEWDNGAFTKALVEGIGGKADYTGKGKITVNMLDLYLSERVKELTKGRQTPTTTKPETVPDFPIAVQIGGKESR